jgi:hypothetical protein
VVLGLLVVGALVVVAVTAGDEDSPSSPASPASTASTGDEEGGGTAGLETWTAPANDGEDPGEVIRTLTVGSDLIVVTQRDVTSLDRSTGEQNWHTLMADTGEAAGRQHVLCGAGTTASDSQQLALTMGFDDDPSGNYDPICGLVALIDLTTGEFGLSKSVAYEGGGSPNPGLNAGMPVEILGDTVVVTWNATIFGLDQTDLSTRWQWVVDSVPGREGDLCEVDDMAQGDAGQVVVMSGCITDVGDTRLVVDEVGASDGTVGRSHEITSQEAGMEEISSLDLVAASPVVIYAIPVIISNNPDPGSLLTLDGSWNLLNVIHDERTTETSDTGLVVNSVGFLSNRTGAWREPSRSLVVGNTLISFTPPNRETNELVAIDLTTGQEIWATTAESGSLFWQVLAADEETVVASAAEPDGPGQSVVTVDLASGQIREETTTPVTQPGGYPTGSATQPDVGYLYADSRAYAVDFDSAGESGARWMAFTVG